MKEGIRFLGKHSYDNFGVTLAPGKSIGNPEKEKVKRKPAFSNKEYDFSLLYGSQTYSMRELKYSFNLFSEGDKSNKHMNNTRTQLINWLMNSKGKQRLYDDAFPGYYFLAEVEDRADFDDDYNRGVLSVTFKAYPFMIAELPEGNNLWDTFNLKLDVLQDVEFEIDGQQEITLINTGTPDVFPTIETNNEMQIRLNGITYTVNAGITKDADIPLSNGENDLIVTGTGTIGFTFYKELI